MKVFIRPILLLCLAILTHAQAAGAVERPVKIQNNALYFSNIEQDLAWFETQEKLIPAKAPIGLFLRIYHSLTLEMVNMFKENKFQDPDWVNRLMLKYVSLYKNALDCEISGACAVSPAWMTAFKQNQLNQKPASIQLILSISAHVNRDLPVALAETGTDFTDESQHGDFQVISQIFQRRMPELIQIVQGYQRCSINSEDETVVEGIIQWAIGRTREESWNYGEELIQAQSDDEEAAVMKKVEAHAQFEDHSIDLFAPVPGFLICLPGI